MIVTNNLIRIFDILPLIFLCYLFTEQFDERDDDDDVPDAQVDGEIKLNEVLYPRKIHSLQN